MWQPSMPGSTVVARAHRGHRQACQQACRAAAVASPSRSSHPQRLPRRCASTSAAAAHLSAKSRHMRVRARRCVLASAQAAAGVGVFPAGQRQARVDLPALMLEVSSTEVLEAESTLDGVNAAVAGGATAVVLSESASGGAASLYEAAVRLKALLQDRAALLLVDRTDIATAVGAEGVVLTSAGVPVVVGRRMVAGAAVLVGARVSSVEAATAAAADGASFVLLQGEDGQLPAPEAAQAAKAQQRSGSAIPVIAAAASLGPASQQRLPGLCGPADGFCLRLGGLPAAAAALGGGAAAAAPQAAVGALLQALTEGGSGAAAAAAPVPSRAPAPVDGSTLRRLLGARRDALVAEEKEVLSRVVALLEQVTPQMGEIGLLRDALAALDDLFLLVVVGEFNSGKSTVINALLGERFMADGVLPTTNEISILRWGGDEGEAAAAADAAASSSSSSRPPSRDGLYERYLPADLLREVNIVDTPGTNVILERQQRLTEEFVPRADLVLFVMSADRPFAESEVRFLEYIRQWRKKVVFVVNKVDMLGGPGEVEQVVSFVAGNASRLLQLPDPFVLPVAARAALRAKLECGAARGSGVLDSVEDSLLMAHPQWQASRFGELERFIYDFLIGGSGSEAGDAGSEAGGAEGMRLKLQTPLYVGDALLAALGRQLAAELAAAQGELAALRAVRQQLTRFQGEMERDSEAQRAACAALVEEAVARSASFVDRTLALSNASQLAPYLLGSADGRRTLPVAAGFDREVVAGTFDLLRKQVSEHAAWLDSNCVNQLAYYSEFLQQRRRPLEARGAGGQGGAAAAGGALGGAAATPAPQASISGTPGAAALAAARSGGGGAGAAPQSLVAVSEFNVAAAVTLLEEEVREAFLGTAGAAAGAQGLGLLAASWLPTTVEDLLAVGLAGLASYVAVLNLPLRRSTIKSKVAGIARNFVRSVTDGMAQEVGASVSATTAAVTSQLEPLQAAWEAEVQRLQAAEARRSALVSELEALERRTANLQ